MSSPELPTNPPEPTQPAEPVKVRAGIYGDLEEHELIQLLDSINDERARARFRESIYISIFVWIAVAWFVFYGPQVLFHAPRLVDPSTILRHQHDMEVAQLNLPPELRRTPPRPRPAKPPAVDSKTLAKLHAEAPLPAPTPAAPPPPPASQPTPLPPVTPPPAPTPAPARALQPANIPDAPAPQVAFNTPNTTSDALRSAANAALRGGPGIPTAPPRSAGNQPAVFPGPRIVSDTHGVNFNSYMQRLHDIIDHSWRPLLPQSIYPPISEHGITEVDFKIMANGDLGGITIITPSGEKALDRAAWGSITTVGKFPPLPKEYPEKFLELQCGYFVNEKLPGD